uniref:Uncharacterized protein n=1 Tax=Rhizophora mucronata TaxID=61149 RepID=A0A2P2J3I2_RHIMU
MTNDGCIFSLHRDKNEVFEDDLPSPKEGFSSMNILAILPVIKESMLPPLTKPVANPNRFTTSSLPMTSSPRKCSFTNLSSIILGVLVTTTLLS